jgi:feruloyl esterase
MMRAFPALAAFAAAGLWASLAGAADCHDLIGLKLDHAAVTSADLVEGGTFTEDMNGNHAPRSYGGLPPFCRVRGISRPVPGSEIGFEVWLPLRDWTRRLQMVGNGGYSSTIYYAQMAQRILAGDVAVGTDTGHKGSELTFAIGHPEAIVDFSHRAVHESVVAAKAVTHEFFDAAPDHSYFAGCSTGGYQALSEAQRYPDDFDGIIAGAPGNNRSNLNLAFLWNFLANHRPGDNDRQIVPNAKLPMINRAVTAQCDRLDGVADGVINDPRTCRFDVASLQCTGEDKPDCLTPEQVATVRKIYAGPKDARSGKQIYPGYPFGAEGGVAEADEKLPGWSSYWANSHKPSEPDRADFFRYWVFNDPTWNWWSFNWASDIDAVTEKMGTVMNATNPNLSAFKARHGKLIMFIGWQDPVGTTREAINYYKSVEDKAHGTTQDFLRFYLVPGMVHCAGGPGATNFSTATRNSEPPVSDAKHDMSVALEDWVEKGTAPDTLIATKYSNGKGPTGTIAFQRPLCAYPKVAHYKGGPKDAADSFDCVGSK